jgi:tRNA threonylcarbamoyladenosine biosynthesis protein TsaB
MSELATLGLARHPDALEIAEMSRDLIEQGLAWSWTPARVRRAILGRDCCVLIARRDSKIAGFAIMHFGDEVAHLNLLAVGAEHRRQGLGRKLIDWLSVSAVAAGVFRIDLEVRETNDGARAFYQSLGFQSLDVVQGYYQGREPALRMSRRLP